MAPACHPPPTARTRVCLRDRGGWQAAYVRGLVSVGRQVKGGGMAKTPGRSDLPAAPNPASPQDIRNVVLVGPGGAGKTALFEALVAARVPGQRTSTGDHVRTTTLTAASFDAGGVTVN